MAILIASIFCLFLCVALIIYSVIPLFVERATAVSERRKEKFSNTIEQLMPRQEAKRLGRLFVFIPLVFGGGFLIFAPEGMRLLAFGIGVALGLMIPGLYIRVLRQKMQEKFNNQLIDALMIMSSSFRGGLSLIQALEAVVDEMPDPINKEFATVLGENKMGVNLETALNHLYNRMPSPALQQMITSILLARETGGNLPVIFQRIVGNIREHNKIKQNIDTLTVQGRIQGVVLSLLPVGFVLLLYSSNARVLENMANSNLGRGMLMYAAVSWVIGVFLIWRISTFKEF